jgi:hypothetical protein
MPEQGAALKAIKITNRNHIACLQGCLHCKRTIKAGQVVLVIERPNAPYASQTRHAHRSCVIALLERAGPEDSEVQFNSLRRKMVASGNAFPN